MHADALRVANFVLDRARQSSRVRWYQGSRRIPLASGLDDNSALAVIARSRIRSVGELEARALIAWSAGERSARLYDRLLSAREVVELQAAGQRCVSLIDDHPDALHFALHDLRHLEKFFAPEHHRAQIGFFHLFARAFARGACDAFDRQLDPTWCSERDSVLADMNGSPIFLFAVLKMKLKVAARRRLARQQGREPPARGNLDAEELAAYAPLLEEFLDALALLGPLRDAARAISARRDDPEIGRAFLTGLCCEA